MEKGEGQRVAGGKVRTGGLEPVQLLWGHCYQGRTAREGMQCLKVPHFEPEADPGFLNIYGSGFRIYIFSLIQDPEKKNKGTAC